MSRHRPKAGLQRLQDQALLLAAKIKEATSRDKAKREAEEYRRRLVAGAAALEHMAAEPNSEFASKLLGLINDRARSITDRALFNLAPLAKESEASSAS